MALLPEIEKGADALRKRPPLSETSLPEPLLAADRASAILGIHPKTLQRMARKGEIRGIHVGKLWRFRASEIEAWIEERLAG
jgi:excisionase family DNA binding protein